MVVYEQWALGALVSARLGISIWVLCPPSPPGHYFVHVSLGGKGVGEGTGVSLPLLSYRIKSLVLHVFSGAYASLGPVCSVLYNFYTIIQKKNKKNKKFKLWFFWFFDILIRFFLLDLLPGSQKDRHRGTSGAKEGFSSIGRFSKK